MEICKMAVKIAAVGLNLYYGKKHALKNIDLKIRSNAVTALIGPSGCGKSSFLKCINRMNDLTEGARVEGSLLLDGENVYDKDMDPVLLRKKVGMLFQQPNLFPMSIYDNVAYGLRLRGRWNKTELERKVEEALRKAAVFEEVKDRLGRPALGLSGGQQQRICIARALAAEPEVLLMDEPTSALDPVSAGKIEELMEELGKNRTLVAVTHNMRQAARVAEDAVFFLDGEIVEAGSCAEIFRRPKDRRTEAYLSGRFG